MCHDKQFYQHGVIVCIFSCRYYQINGVGLRCLVELEKSQQASHVCFLLSGLLRMQNRKKILHALVVAISLTICGCFDKTVDDYMRSASQYIEAENFKAAIIEIKNALLLEPEQPKLRLELGKLYIKSGDFYSAEKELNKALLLGASELDVYPSLVKASYFTGSFVKANELSRKFTANFDFDPVVTLYHFLSEINIENDAIGFPEPLDGSYELIARAYHYYILNEVEEAWKVTESFKQQGPEALVQSWLRGVLALQRGENDIAIKELELVNSLAPSLSSPRFQLAEALLRAGKLEEAAKKINKLLSESKRNAYANYLKSSLLFQQQQYAEALTYAEQALQNGLSGMTTALVIAGVSAYQTTNLELAYFYLQKAEPELAATSLARRVLAQTQLKLGYTEEAVSELAKWSVLGEQDEQIFAVAAGQLSKKGKVEEARDLIIQASDSENPSTAQQLREGMLRLAADDKAGLEVIESVLKKEPSLEKGWLLLADSYLQEGNVEEALQVAADWREQDRMSGLTLNALILWEVGRENEAFESIRDALDEESEHKGANQTLLTFYLASGAYEKALAQATYILSYRPDDYRVLFTVAGLGIRTGIGNEALATLLQHSETHKDLLTPKIALASLYRVTGDPQKAYALLSPLLDELNELGLLTLGDAALQMGEEQEAFDVYELFKTKYPANKLAWLRSIGASELLGNVKQAYEISLEANKKFVDDSELSVLLLMYQTQLGKITDADRQLTSIKANNATSPILSRVEGELALAKKNYAQAATLLLGHYKSSPSFNTAVLAAKALQKNGRYTEAFKILDDEFKKLTQKTKARHTMAEFHIFNEEYDSAAELYEDALIENKNDFAALNNLASIKIKQKDYQLALEYAERAYVVAPSLAQIVDTYGYALLKAKKLEQAQEVLKKAYEMAPMINDIRLHLAELFILQGKQDDAQALLSSIKPKSPSEKVLIENLLEKLK